MPPLSWSDFDLTTRLGEGQAGVVWGAVMRRSVGDLTEGSRIAVKRYKPWVLERPGQFDRIMRELNVGRTVAHPALVRTHGVVLDDDGRPVLVMPWYEGESLERTLMRARQAREPVDAAQAMKWVGHLAGALAALHNAGAIHRDVKPANVLVTPDGLILMDLGVVFSTDFPEQTDTGTFLGTIRYGAPEYLFGEFHDQRSDVYSLAAIAYELFFNAQFLGEHQHWARVILNKNEEVEWTRDQLTDLARRSTHNLADLADQILHHGLAAAVLRDLDLYSLETAIGGRVWEGSFVSSDGRIAAGPRVFPTYSGLPLPATADQVPGVLDRLLTIQAQRELHSLLEVYFWDGDFFEKPASIRQLVDAGVIHPVGDGNFFFAPVVRHAFQLGLLRSGST